MTVISILLRSIPIFAEDNLPERNVKEKILVDGTIYDKDGNVLDEGNIITTVENENLNISPRMLIIYKTKNKKLLKKYTVLSKYLTQSLDKASRYHMSQTVNNTASIKISGTYNFGKVIKASGDFSLSRSNTASIGIELPADPKRDSKLAFFDQYARYSCDAYETFYDSWGTNGYNDKFMGSGTVDEPIDTYIKVHYK